MKKKKDKAIDIALIMLLIVAIISGLLFLHYLLDYKKSNDFYKEANKGIEILETNSSISYDFETENDFIIEEKSFDMNIDFSEFPESVIGWIYIPDNENEISYPITQGKDNEYFLSHDYSGKYNKAGSIFLHSDNSPCLTDYHSIIYGHNMKAGTMFSRIKKYQDKEFLNEHRYVYIKLRSGELKKYYVYSVFRTEDLSDAYKININNKEESFDFINYTIKNNKIGNTITFNDNSLYRIVTLSTCISGSNKLERCVVNMVEIPNS